MYKSSGVSGLFLLSFSLAICASLYLYLYPIFHGCAFPGVDASAATSFTNTVKHHGWFTKPDQPDNSTELAPFRLLVLADPQLEGDSSLPKPEDAFVRRLGRHWDRIYNSSIPVTPAVLKEIAYDLVSRDIPVALKALRKRLDLFGNDFYLAHIYRTLDWWAEPTHVTVLGDLIGSQWVTDDEFNWRGWRYWNRVFAGAGRVDDEITTVHKLDDALLFSMNDTQWRKRVINIAGNHDIGYAGDISETRIERFERVFGRANWDVRFQYPEVNNGTESFPTLHMIVLNTLNIDGPAYSEQLQKQTYEYLNSIIMKRSHPVEERSSFTLLLTHLPLHKDQGVCVDGPYFDYWNDEDAGGWHRPLGLKEQHHLGEYASRQAVLQGLFGFSGDRRAPAGGRGRSGLILNGHDHEGCDVWHHIVRPGSQKNESSGDEAETTSEWNVAKWDPAIPHTHPIGLREITVRSMMGEFGGNAGLLSVWFDLDAHEWKYDIQMCRLGVQHIWWAVHLLDLFTLGVGLGWILSACWSSTKAKPLLRPRPSEPIVAKQGSGHNESSREKSHGPVKH